MQQIIGNALQIYIAPYGVSLMKLNNIITACIILKNAFLSVRQLMFNGTVDEKLCADNS